MRNRRIKSWGQIAGGTDLLVPLLFQPSSLITLHSVTGDIVMTSLCKHNRYSMLNKIQIDDVDFC